MKLESIIVRTDLACEVGLPESIILGHFHYWTVINSTDESMIKDDRVWLFASRRAIQSVLPFLSDKVIRNSIDRLIEAGWLIKGEFSLAMTQKANWYSLTDLALSWFNRESSPLAQTANALALSTNDINKNKENKLSIEEKRRILREKCEPYVAQYGRPMIEAFLNYWGEANGESLRCEIAKRKSGAFEISRRLATWASKEYNQPSRPAQTQKPKPAQKPIWESLGMTREQYLEIHKK